MTEFFRATLDTIRMHAVIEGIARDVLAIDTLETRNRDDLDFHDISVWKLRSALCRAYQAGRNSAILPTPKGETHD